MIFTQREIQDLFRIIDYRIARIIADVLGKEFLLPQDLEAFREFDFDFLTEVGKLSPYYQSFIFGRLSSILTPEQLKTLNYKDISAYISKDQYSRLSSRERAEYNAAATRSYGYIKGIGNRVKESLGNSLFEEEFKSSAETKRMEALNALSDETIRGVIEKKSVKSIVSALGNRLDDWNKDWGRVVETEMHNIYSIGQAQVIMEAHGLDARVYKEVYSGACTNCRRLFTTAGSGSKPRIFKLKDLINNGDNIGKKAKDWLPVIGAVHPYCYSDDTEVLTRDGFRLFSELKGNEEFLSVNLETGEGEYTEAVEYLKIPYKGQLIERTSRDFNLCTTPNHMHVGLSSYDNKLKRVATLRKEIDLPNNFRFLTHLPKWTGDDRESITFDGINYPMDLFCEFMGYYISEGSYTDWGHTHRVNISQLKDSRIKMFECCEKLFASASLQKERIEIYLKKDQIEFISLLKSLGHAADKFIPSFIKDSSVRYLNIFLDAFCLGDGTIHRGTVFDGYQCNPMRVFSTSSLRLKDDIGELILKTGKRPSYRNKGKAIYCCKKQKKDYVAKNDQWEINELSTKYNARVNMTEILVDYDGIVYDVELKKNHTLIVRRKGKVCVSGNCRCELRYIPEGYEWDEKTESFEPPKNYERKVERKSKVKITVGTKVFEV